MRVIYNIFEPTETKEWMFKSVKPLDYNQFTITMELAKGATFEDLMRKKPDSAMLTGIWLALFHRFCTKNNDKTINNIDFNRKNILVDYEQKILTVIDPGGINFTHSTSIEEALINFIVGIIIGAVEQKTRPKKLIEYFLNGYFSVSNQRYNLKSFNENLNSVIDSRYRIQKSKRKNKLIPYMVLRIIRLYILCIVPKIIKTINDTSVALINSRE